MHTKCNKCKDWSVNMPCSKLEVSKELDNLLLNIHHEESFGTCDKVTKAIQAPPLFIKKTTAN